MWGGMTWQKEKGGKRRWGRGGATEWRNEKSFHTRCVFWSQGVLTAETYWGENARATLHSSLCQRTPHPHIRVLYLKIFHCVWISHSGTVSDWAPLAPLRTGMNMKWTTKPKNSTVKRVTVTKRRDRKQQQRLKEMMFFTLRRRSVSGGLQFHNLFHNSCWIFS